MGNRKNYRYQFCKSWVYIESTYIFKISLKIRGWAVKKYPLQCFYILYRLTFNFFMLCILCTLYIFIFCCYFFMFMFFDAENLLFFGLNWKVWFFKLHRVFFYFKFKWLKFINFLNENLNPRQNIFRRYENEGDDPFHKYFLYYQLIKI